MSSFYLLNFLNTVHSIFWFINCFYLIFFFSITIHPPHMITPLRIQLCTFRSLVSRWWITSCRRRMWFWWIELMLWKISGSLWLSWIVGVTSVLMLLRWGSKGWRSSTIMLCNIIHAVMSLLTSVRSHSLQGIARTPHRCCNTPKARSISLRAASWRIEKCFPISSWACRSVLMSTGHEG